MQGKDEAGKEEEEMTSTYLQYHTDFQGIRILASKTDVIEASKFFDELIILSADTGYVGYKRTKSRIHDILVHVPKGTKVVIGTSGLFTNTPFIPNLKAYRDIYRDIDFTGVYINEESFYHPRFYRLWRALNRIKERKVWIPYTGAWKNELYTLPQIGVLKGKFDQVYIQPNHYQIRYNKQPWQMENIKRFIKNNGLGVEFEIDDNAIDGIESYDKAEEYFSIFKDIKDRAYYTGAMSINMIRDSLPEYYKAMQESRRIHKP